MSIPAECRREAYERLKPESMRKRITELLKENGGMTSTEIMDFFGVANPNNVRPRLTELKEVGVIKAVDKRTPRSRNSIFKYHMETVWELDV